MITDSVARLEVAGKHRGTAFVVTPDLLVTCAHCVPPTGARVRAVFACGDSVQVVVVDPRPELDLALLAVDLDALPSTAVPLALGRADDARRGRPVDAPGWPLDNPAATKPQVLTGTIDQPLAWFRDGVEALRVASDQVAAGARPRGSSGSPVVVRAATGAVVVGVLTWIQEDDDDPERAVGGVVYATPIDRVTGTWASLPRPTDPLGELAGGGGDTPYASAIRETLAARLHGPEGTMPFAGREEVLARLDRWLDDVQGPDHHLLSGPIGIGKSTVVLRWALRALDRPHRAVLLIPIGKAAELTPRRPVVRALAHRLAAVHREVIDDTADTDDLAESVRARLSRPAPTGTTVVVVLDGLDEAVGWRPGRLLPRTTGAGVRVLLTARWTENRPSTAAWREALDLPPDTATTDLGALAADALADLVHQVRRDAGPGEVAETANHLARLTGGDPITTALHLRDLAASASDIASWSRSLAAMPPGLDGVVDGWLRDQAEAWEDTNRADDAERVLRLLTLAHGPLPRVDLAALCGRIPEPIDGVRLRQALDALARLTLPGPGENTVILAHPALSDTLRRRREGENVAYRDAFVRWGVNVLDDLARGEVDPQDTPIYLVSHLADHLADEPVFRKESLRLLGTTWRRVHDAVATDADAHRRDIETISEHARDLDSHRAGRLRLLPERALCAAEAAAASRAASGSISPELAAALVHHHIWRPERGISHVDTLLPRRTGRRSAAVVRMAPDIPVDAFDAFAQLVTGAVDDDAFSEERAAAAAAWACRLLEEGFISEALRVPAQLDENDRARGYVAAWVLADLAAELSDDLLGPALAAALLDHVRAQRRPRWRRGTGRGGASAPRHVPNEPAPPPYGMARLTRAIPLGRAERIWHAVEQRMLDDLRREADRWPNMSRPAAMLGAVLSVKPVDGRSLAESNPGPELFVRYFDPLRLPASLDDECFVAAAPWLDSAYVAERVVRDIGNKDGPSRGVEARIHYDGLLGAASPVSAPALYRIVSAWPAGAQRLGGIAQLLSHLDGELHTAAVAAFFDAGLEELDELNAAVNTLRPALAALLADGHLDSLLDRLLERPSDSSRLDWFMTTLTPILDLSRIDDALSRGRLGSHTLEQLDMRRAMLDFDYAVRLLERAHDTSEVSTVPTDAWREFTSRVSEVERPASDERPRVAPWWSVLELGPGGPSRVPFPRQAVRPGDVATALREVGDQTDPASFIDLAADVTVTVDEEQCGLVVEVAESLSDPWPALAMLAAATHVRPGPVHDKVRGAAKGMFTRARERVRSWPYAGIVLGVHPDAWLGWDFDPWAPFVARLVAPNDRAFFAAELFEGGFDAVLDGQSRDWGSAVDDWILHIASLTPLLGQTGMEALETLVRGPSGLQSGTLRGWAYVGVAAGWAAEGDLTRAYQAASTAAGTDPAARTREALVEILRYVPSGRLPEWVATVRRSVHPASRARLWDLARPQVAGATEETARRVIDQLFSGGPSRRSDILADAALALPVIARLGGVGECQRLERLLGEWLYIETSE